MLNCRFTPIQKWPGQPTPSYQRTRGAFKAGWSNTLDLLERELNQLRAKDITVEGFFFREQIRNDGWPKAAARPTQPGVVLSFDTAKGRMVMPCDKYLGWESNLRAIALTLEHLRAVERYGATYHGEQYTGWLKLPAASAIDEAEQLAIALAQMAGIESVHANTIATNQDAFDRAWREAVRRTHPDGGGSAEEFTAAIAARDRIRELKGWS
jgi:hypothetical protein